MKTIPEKINVLDNNGGFTALINGNTLWRNANFLKNREWNGSLIDTVENTFFQSDAMDKTRAKYKVPGYKYPIVLWFDKNGNRIA